MFKTMTGCINPKSNPTDDEISKIAPFIFCRWLSGNPHAIKAANQINFYYNIPIINQYNMIKSAFAGKIKYIPYPKTTSIEKIKQTEYLVNYFKISEEKAREYMNLIDPSELKYITEMYESQTGKSK
jgi:hypothetical protein